MKITVLNEPDLEFAYGGRHQDPRHGIDFFGPADIQEPASRAIRVGIVGSQESIDGVRAWLDRCRGVVAARDSHLSHLYVPFPGFDTDRAFRSTIVWNSRLERPISRRDLASLDGVNPLAATKTAVDMYDQELQALHEEPNCDVVIVCRPDNLIDTGTTARAALRVSRGSAGAAAPEAAASEATGAASPARASRGSLLLDDSPNSPGEPKRAGDGPGRGGPLARGAGDFHSLLKARSLRYSQPIQLVRRSTWDPTFKGPKDAETRVREDEATRAWNLHTALYYKAGGVPWRLPRDPQDLATCFVGVAFFPTSDDETLETSVAQVFNQRGDGVIVRGGQARVSKSDRQPHLSEDAAQSLLSDALEKFHREHRHSPARVVLHKTSSFTDAEAAGFRGAADEERIDCLELVWVTHSEPLRLFRRGDQPPLRGTFVSLDEGRHVLYTRGSVVLYQTYPSLRIPQPLGIRLQTHESSPQQLAEEVLALTKMNWNGTRLDGRDPITLRTADRVGDILRHLDSQAAPQARYAFYM